jgi:type I restriction enzyme, S subunit
MALSAPAVKALGEPLYKQTEVGLIPVDWIVSSVGAEFNIQLGKMLDAEKNIGVAKFFLGNRAIRWGHIDLTDIGEIKLTTADLHRYRLRDGDLLVCEGGEIGRAAIWDQPLGECYFQKALHCLRPIRGFNTILMLNILRQYSVTGFLQNYVTQTSIAHLPKDKFRIIPVGMPPSKREQNDIAEALSDADALIAALEQLLFKKQQIKQGAMQELLTGKRRLLTSDTQWQVKTVKELGEVTTGGTPSTKNAEFWGGQYAWITPTDISIAKNIWSSERTLTDRGLRVIRELQPNTVLVTCIASIGKNAILMTSGGCNQQINAVTPNAGNLADFIYYLFELNKPCFLANASTTATSMISKATFERMSFAMPSLAEQTAIATILTDLDTEITAIQTKLTKARDVKQGMMQQLLTGRIRLV